MSRNRVIHLIRHAESEFNVLANHQTEGFIPIVTKLDANLTPTGFDQAKTLGHRLSTETINGYNLQHPMSPINAEIVITSPLSRAILTASHSLPYQRYKFGFNTTANNDFSQTYSRYIVRPEISEQIENTTDLPAKKDELLSKFPYLEQQISMLPDCWWHRHPDNRNSNDFDPQIDADLLHSHNGKEPASESKELLRRRVQWFFKWLTSERNKHWNNIVVFSHCCTIYEMERYLRGYSDDVNGQDLWTMPKNTEVRSFEMSESVMDIMPTSFSTDANDFDGYFTGSALVRNYI